MKTLEKIVKLKNKVNIYGLSLIVIYVFYWFFFHWLQFCCYFISDFFRNLILRARSKKYRLQEQEIIIEGSQAIMAAVKAGAKLKSLFFSGIDTLQKFDTEFLTDIPLYKIKYDHVKTCTQTDMPEGILGRYSMISWSWFGPPSVYQCLFCGSFYART